MKKFITISTLIILTISFSTSLMATGIGGFFIGGAGESTYDAIDPVETKFTLKSKEHSLGGGLVIDTCLAGNKVFNYRFLLSYQQNQASRISTSDYHKFNMTHIFGFAPVRTKVFRLWMGPEIDLQFSYGKESYLYSDVMGAITSSMMMTMALGVPAYASNLYKVKNEYMMGRAGGGLAVGFNINIGKFITLSASGHGIYGYNVAETKLKGKGMSSLYVPSIPMYSVGSSELDKVKETITGHGWEAYACFAVIFRINDTYEQPKKIEEPAEGNNPIEE